LRLLPAVAFRGAAASVSLFALFGFNPQSVAASVDTWTGADTGASTDWATADNWSYSTGTGPIASGDGLIFTSTNALATSTLTDSLTTTAFDLGLNGASITFAPGAISYTLTGNAFAITAGMVDNSTNLETINNPISIPSTHSITVASGGTLKFGGNLSGAGGITAAGAGTIILTVANGYTGTTSVNGSVLDLNFTASGAPITNIISASSILSLGGGSLDVVGSSASSTQAFASTTMAAAHSVVSAAGSASVALKAITYDVGSTVELLGPAYNNAPTTASGQSSSGLVPAVGTITTTSGGANALLVSTTAGNADDISYATVGLYDFAIGSGSTPFTLVGASQGTGGTAGDGAYLIDSTGNLTAGQALTDVIGTVSIGNPTTSAGAIRFNAAGAGGLTLAGVASVDGILVTPNVGANNTTITVPSGDALEPGLRSSSNAGSMSLVQNNTSGFLIISGGLSDGKTAGGTFVLSGSGTISYTGANSSYTGATYLTGGVAEIIGDGAFSSTTGAVAVTVNGGTILGAGTFSLDAGGGADPRPVTLGSNGGGLAALTGDTMTVDGLVSGAGTLIVGIPASSANGSTFAQVPGTGTGTANAQQLATGTVVLTHASNTYTGGTLIDTGILQLASTSTLGTGGVTLNGGTFQWGSGNTTDISTAGLTIAAGGGTFDTNGNAVKLASAVAGSGSITVQNSTGAGSLTLNGKNTFTGGVTVTSGGLILGAANVYTGATSVTGGALTLNVGSSLANTGITLGSGGALTAALTGNSNINIGTTGATLALNGGSTLTLQASDADTLDTLTLNSTVATGAGTALTVGGASTPASLSFDLGSAGSDELVINDGVTAFGADGGKIFITDLDTNTPAASYTLVSDPSGGLLAGGSSVGSDFWLGTTGLTEGGQAYALSLTSSGTSLVLNVTINNPNYYWTGGTSSSWATTANFATTQTGATAQSTPLSATSNVFLTANTASNFSQTLDGSYSINSLSFTGSGTSAAGNPILLAAGSGTALTLNAANSFLDSGGATYASGIGLVVQPGSDTHTISANIDLGNSQTWQVNNSPANPLTVTGVIADAVSASGDSLTKSGTGTLILSNAETYDGGTNVQAGTLLLGSGGSLLATGALAVSGTGTFDLGGNSQTVSHLSDGGSSNGIITSSLGAATLTVNSTSAGTFGGTITDSNATNGSSLALSLAGSSTLTLSGSNNFTGGVAVTGGNLIASNNYSLGSNSSANANAGLTLNPAASTTSNVFFTSASPSLALLNTGVAGGTSNIILGNTSAGGSATTLNIGDGGTNGESLFGGTISDLVTTAAGAIGNLNVLGGGFVVLSGANTFTGLTTITGASSELELQNANALQDSTLSYGSSGGTLVFSGISAVTLAGLTGSHNLALTNAGATGVALTIGGTNLSTLYTGNLGGAGSLDKIGTGTLQIGSGASGGATYAGTTTVGEGTLILGGATSLVGQVDLTGALPGGVQTLDLPTSLTVQDNAVINSTAALNIASNDGGNINNFPGVSTLLVTGTASVTAASLSIGNGSRVPIGVSVTVANLASLTINGPLDLMDDEGTTAGGSAIDLNGGTLATQQFTDIGGGNTHTETINFSGGVLKALANDPNASTFLPAFTTLTVSVNTGGAVINTNGFDITFAHALAHGTGTPDGGLTLSDATATPGILTLTGANTYTGATTINTGATLQLGNGTTGNDGTILTTSGITDDGTLIYNRFGALSSAVAINGPGAVTKIGSGSQTLSASNGYTGATTIAGGLLVVSGALSATTSVAVSNNATLELTDNNAIFNVSHIKLSAGILEVLASEQEILGDLTVASGSSTLTLGASADVINFADSSADIWTGTLAIADWNGNGADLNGGGSDQVIFTGDDLTPAQLSDITFVDPTVDGIAFATSLGAIQLSDGEIVAAVPEPGTWAMRVAGAGMLCVWQRSRRTTRRDA
jgi:fibronectin-binding autotransporter adhesin